MFWNGYLFVLRVGLISLYSKEPGWPETSGTGGITPWRLLHQELTPFGSTSSTETLRSPNLNLIPKHDPKNASILMTQNFKSQKLDSFRSPKTVIRVKIAFVFHGFFMSVVMNFKHTLASPENKEKKSPPSVGMIFAIQFANRNGGEKINIYILYIHNTDI